MKRRTGVRLGLAALAVAVLAMLGLGRRGDPGVAVQVEPVRAGDVSATVTGAGEIAARLEVSVSARTSGELVAVEAREGDRVVRGQLLGRVDPRLLEANVQESSASLAAARADRERLAAELERAEAQHRRLLDLHQKGVLSEDALDEARYQLDARRAAVSAQDQRVQQQDAWVRRSRQDVSNAEVRAPFDGIVTRVERKVGENVIGAQSFSPTPILVLSDLSSVDALVRVHERDIERVAVGQEATVTVDALGDARLRGRVREVGSAGRIDPSTGARAREFLVRIALDDPEKRLRPGLSALAEVVVARKQGVLRVVPEALVPDPSSPGAGASSPPGGQAVFVVRDGRAALQRVGTGLVGDDFVEVTGVAAGATVVVGPYRTVRALREGQALQVAARPQAAAP